MEAPREMWGRGTARVCVEETAGRPSEGVLSRRPKTGETLLTPSQPTAMWRSKRCGCRGRSQHPPSQLPFAAQCGQAPFRSKRRAATEWRRRGRRGRGAGPGRRGAGRGCEGSRTRSRGSRPGHEGRALFSPRGTARSPSTRQITPQRTWGRRGSEPQRRTIPAEARPGFGRS